MSLNIIVKGGKRSGMSGEEMAHYLSKKVERDAEREKAGDRKRAIRSEERRVGKGGRSRGGESEAKISTGRRV